MANDSKTTKDLMEYRYLGRTGLRVSVLSFGAWVNESNQKNKQLSIIVACDAFSLGNLWRTN